MTNGFLKKIKKGGNEAAKRVLVRIGEEIAEVPKHAGTQVVGSEAHPSPVVEALQGVKDVTPEEQIILKGLVTKALSGRKIKASFI